MTKETTVPKQKGSGEQETAGGIFTRTWPMFLQIMSITPSYAWIFVNVVFVSLLIWPGEPFHAAYMGILYGSGIIIKGFSNLLFGALADRFSRIKLMSAVTACFGVGYIVNSFVPVGGALSTFYLFLLLNSARQVFDGGLGPVHSSYIDDSIEEHNRSQLFGLGNIAFQLFQFIGFIVSAFIFQRFWREFFFALGALMIACGAIIRWKGVEPKRGALKSELKHVLGSNGIVYDYKLTKAMVKETILAPSNILIFAEGLFTLILFSVPNFVFIAYMQSPPRNISPGSMGFFTIVFVIPGVMIGPAVFAKVSDRLAQKALRNRIFLIVVSLIIIYTIYTILFLIPVPDLTPAQGNDFGIVMSHPEYWAIGACSIAFYVVQSIYSTNQAPLIQKINLPEAQGTIASANQFLESVGFGIGPIISGLLLEYFGGNYQVTVTLLMSIGICGTFFWLFAARWVARDAQQISNILKERAAELEKKGP
jgi:MFS family permease